jgi:hypothetical protein
MDKSLQHTFSILIYRESQFLEDCILSLTKQTVPSHILLSTSTPSSFLDRIAEKHGMAIACNPRRRSISDDWTFAYNAAPTRFVTLTHQDDIYSPRYTERCLRLADCHRDCLIVFADYNEWVRGVVRHSNSNLIIKRVILACSYLGKESLTTRFRKKILLCLGSPIPCPTVMFNKDAIGSFEFSNAFSINLDWDAWLRLSEMRGSFLFANEQLVTHRIHEDSQTSAGIGKGVRRAEDKILFARLWPAPIAWILTCLYSLSYASNQSTASDESRPRL